MEEIDNLDMLTLRNAEPADYKNVLRLCDERYGEGYVGFSDFEHWLQKPEMFKVALVNGVYAGFAVMTPATVQQIMEKMAMPETDVLTIVGSKPALIYKSAALEPSFEHRGIMKKMVAELLKQSEKDGYGSVFGSAWVVNGEMPIGGIFRTFDFQYLYDRHMLWYHDEKYRCVVCNGRCCCDAAIYYKKL